MEEVKEKKEEEIKVESNKKKPNKLLFTISMLVIFLVITEGIIWGKAGKTLTTTIIKYPQGSLVVGEAVLAALVLIVMLLFKNSYVFTQKREKYTKGFFYGTFYLIGIVLFTLMFGVIGGGLFVGLPLINLIVGCFLIGVAEEFLCRGWLLNEFLERFGDTKKGIWYSIIISGIIFGLIHLGNIYTMGQSVPTTILQAMSAAATGIFLGLIYYKTKNIWTVVTLHGLWDFSLFLNNISPIYETAETASSISVIGIIFGILMAGSELINTIPYIKDIDAEPKKGKVIGFAFLSMFLFFMFTMIRGVFDMEIGDTYEFDNLSLENYSILNDNYEDYSIDYSLVREIEQVSQVENTTEETVDDENLPVQESVISAETEHFSFTLAKKDKNVLEFKNNNSGKSIELESTRLTDYIILEEKDYYVLAYVDSVDSTNVTLRYIYLNKEELSNDDSYLDNIKTNMKKYILASESVPELVVLGDRKNDKSYVAAYDVDYGYLVLIEDGKMAVLNRD